MASQTLLVFEGLESFEEYWSGVLSNAPHLEFLWYFSHAHTGVMDFGDECHSQHINQGYKILTGFIIGGVNLDHLRFFC